MSQHTVETQWMGKMQFNALIDGHTVIMDTPENAGGDNNGPVPKPFILSSLSGCTGMDVAAILRKQQKQVKNFSIKATGELSERHPVEYVSIHLIYEFTGEEEYKEAALHAVTVSQEKYCGVSHMLKKALTVTWQVIYNNVEIFSNKLNS